MRRIKDGKMVEIEIKDLDDFINDIIKVYKKHNMSLSLEEYSQSFIIEKYSEENILWLKSATKGYNL